MNHFVSTGGNTLTFPLSTATPGTQTCTCASAGGVAAGTVRVLHGWCNLPCLDDNTEYCGSNSGAFYNISYYGSVSLSRKKRQDPNTDTGKGAGTTGPPTMTTTTSVAASNPTPAILTGWTYEGCFSLLDYNPSRDVFAWIQSQTMSQEVCEGSCGGAYGYVATGAGNYCFCGATGALSGSSVDASIVLRLVFGALGWKHVEGGTITFKSVRIMEVLLLRLPRRRKRLEQRRRTSSTIFLTLFSTSKEGLLIILDIHG